MFKVAYQESNFLFIHAGINKAWFREFIQLYNSLSIVYKWDTGEHINLATMLNNLNETKERGILYKVGQARGGRFKTAAGPIWADESETKNDFSRRSCR